MSPPDQPDALRWNPHEVSHDTYPEADSESDPEALAHHGVQKMSEPCAQDGTCSCAKFADDPAICERKAELVEARGRTAMAQFMADPTERGTRIPQGFSKEELYLAGYRHGLAAEETRTQQWREFGHAKERRATEVNAGNAALTKQVAELQRDLAHWKANHQTEVERARFLKERPDLPVERIACYEHYQRLVLAVGQMALERQNALATAEDWGSRLDALHRVRDRMKREAGFDESVSFDEVWKQLLSVWNQRPSKETP